MKNILETIIDRKKMEVEKSKLEIPVDELKQSAFYKRPAFSLKQFLLDPGKTGIIAEYKRQSPSKGIINDRSTVEDVTRAYYEHGASCLSVLTDKEFFGGTANDLINARFNPLPILRKDFIIDHYQVEEARSMGADVILLIASCLDPGEVRSLAAHAADLQMEVLLELHDESELAHVCSETGIIGINNRNLKTFEVDIDHSMQLAGMLPDGKLKIAESGIHDVETISILRQAGFHGFLIGERFMKEPDPTIAFARFVQQLKN